ncbi:MAG: DUF4179 domain-containing protein [Butyrivibrio sp.]|nr:DUF4179 domain-containing protein [Butyrivibrio sp.]
MNKDMDKLLKAALTPIELPDTELNELNDRILLKLKERDDMKNEQRRYKGRIGAAAAIVIGVLLVCSGTAFALYKYLSPAEVAMETSNDALQKAFLSDDAILVNETVESGGYRITLLGSVTGKDINEFISDGVPKNDRIYTVVAIERADGIPMPDTSSDDYGKEAFYVSHYIHGLNPVRYSLMSMGGGYTELVRDGIQYRILDMDNIEMFADRGIYVGVSSGTFYDAEAYIYDENTGEMSRNGDYGGVNVLFKLPVDKSKADPAAAEAYLKEFELAMNTPSQPKEKDAVDLSVDEFMEKLTPENIDEYAVPVETTRQICTIDEQKNVNYSYDLGESTCAGITAFDSLFPDGNPGMSSNFGYSYSESGLADLYIDVFILNEDGTVTYVVYQPKDLESELRPE